MLHEDGGTLLMANSVSMDLFQPVLTGALMSCMDKRREFRSSGQKKRRTMPRVHGTVCLHVDDLFLTGDSYFHKAVVNSLRKDCQVGSEDVNDVMFVGQRIK